MENDQNNPKVADLIKKLVSAGLGAAFMTEESIRQYLGEMKLPKDVIQSLIQNANKSKEEMVNRVGNEVIKVIQKIDFVGEASRFVEEHTFKISAEIDVVKKNRSEKDPKEKSSDIRASVSIS